LPPARHPEAVRTLYFFAGPSIKIDDRLLTTHSVAVVRSDIPIALEAGSGDCELLMLQGRPIGEPVAQHGPFVMNTRAEIQQAFVDYQRTRFGGWPWPKDDPVHGRDAGRFARHVDGRLEKVDEP
jgi:redox-sensitive bicupin YhaK (pirin superfamily)